MSKLNLKNCIITLSGILTLFIHSACTSQNPGYIGRQFQTLTAHYNIYFNAKEAFSQSETKIKETNVENYTQLLEVYPVPTEKTASEQTTNLNEVIKRANTIALEKSASTWVDDAYLLLAKAEYYKGNFFNAAEYFDYVSLNYTGKKEANNRLEALICNAKTNMAIQRQPEADSLLNLASQIVTKSKMHQSILNATLAQAAVNNNDDKTAIKYLKQAIKLSKNKFDTIRWTFILAQLEENVGLNNDAFAHYTRVVKSNASFELSFIANLYRIKVKEAQKGENFDKIATLKKLIKDDKNFEYIDQIYYQIAMAYLQTGKLDLALQNFKKSVDTNPGSEQQKGLSSLKLAEINFDSLKNYVKAQVYYDSTLQFLPKDYIGYELVEKKAKNLQYLADRMQIVDKTDTLLALAALPDSVRTKKINAMIALKIKAVREKDSLSNVQLLPSSNAFDNKTKSNGVFYFNNSSATSQGINEFTNRWGKRKLTDNWRLSAVAENSVALANNILDPDAPTEITQSVKNNNPDSLKANYLRDVPLLPADKEKANIKVLTALYEIANFYKDVLNDEKAAIKVFEEVLKRYPQTNFSASIYYQLYRLYTPTDNAKAEEYKKLLLEKYPLTDFAKAIIDPDFGKTKELRLAALNTYYETVYDLYTQNKYTDVISKIAAADSIFKVDSTNLLPPKFAYINALATGYTQNINPFLTQLENITKTYTSDSTITPTVLKQIIYIKQNKTIFDNRTFALVALPLEDGNLPVQQRYVSPKVVKYNYERDIQPAPVISKAIDHDKNDKKRKVSITNQITTNPKDEVTNPANLPGAKPVQPNDAKKPETLKPAIIKFEDWVRQKQAIVINVLDRSLNIAKSFAGVSKYFLTKFGAESTTIVIKEFDKGSKLIIVKGEFYSKERTKVVLDNFKEKINEYIVMPAYKYNTFIISDDNLKLISSQNGLDQYLKYLKEAK
ncbi:MAG: hypothetical protein EAZ15_06665 [Sphingobacteriales bacterium]|nr:MAG: hypothetical protein EAZ15_06665 [Sphingobacteriales bacterium]